ncbi:hypothetical protein CVU82_01670 [Candidatus Falkowbacteria bacterium HGW-Falkowbacteria-1]|uniref:Uncharacterized protein n=1 Tax=Candidatus Falkowbacteria bacterium HGW-Falkowbacteria-1 TaxID=2013768 RepID=A0A2N2E9B3_9BACT|nr:MAG: hypothetical protein CVU82_01670 [Candidatus Falkowbacteria bacterium HGW-Falkowbacteria-1]
MILFITPNVIYRRGLVVINGGIQLIARWSRDRLIIKEVNAMAYDGLHFFPNEDPIGGKVLECPIIDLISLREDGTGWNVEGETADGKKFKFPIHHDFVEGKNYLGKEPIYFPFWPHK